MQVVDLAAARAARAASARGAAEDAELRQAHTLAADTLRGFLAELDARAPGAADVDLRALLGEVMDCLAAERGATAADVMERAQERVSMAAAPVNSPREREAGRPADGDRGRLVGGRLGPLPRCCA